MRYQGNASKSRFREAVILLAVLVVVVLLTLAAYEYSELVTAEYRAADSYTRAGQARALAASGVQYAAALLSNPNSFSTILNSNPYDNAQAFQGVIVQPSGQPRFQGRFSIVAPLDPDQPSSGSQPFRYGIIDESAKININALMQLSSDGKIAHDVLINLPNMTEGIVNSILDWIDADDDPRPGGAENDYYSGLTPSYRCKNGPLTTVEELLLVQGVTPALLLGNDRNRNGMLDPGEDDGTGVVDRGWAAYLTVYSRELNLDSDGNPKININDKDTNSLATKLQTVLSPDLANFILAYRLYGPTSSKPGAGSRGPAAPAAAARAQGMQQLTSDRQNVGQRRLTPVPSIYALINSNVSIPSNNPQTQPVPVPNPLSDSGTLRQYLPVMLDKLWTSSASEIPARINVNTAPRAVLACLPGLTDADVQNIIDHRPNPSSPESPDPIFQTPAWLIAEANFSPNTLKALDQYITGRSQVYRIQSIGYFDGGGPTARIEAVIDTNNQRPRIISWRDLTELGKGFNVGPP
jgi:type II secretory pathway component PulK